MQYAPTQGHVNAPRFVHATQWHALKAACFSGNTVGAYGIRPTERHPMDGECLSTTKGRTLAPLRRDVCGAYAIRPYPGTCKRAAFCICHNRETIQRGAFYVFQRMACPVCVALGYIAIVELLRRAAFHAFRGMA